MDITVDKFGDSKNFSTALNEALNIAKDGDTLIFSKKEYHFYRDFSLSRNIHMTNTDSFVNPRKYFAILLENLKNISVCGNGAVFVIHGDICAIGIIGCSNIKLHDFTVKYASPGNVELNVKEVKGRKAVFEIPESTLWYTQRKDVVFFEQSPFTKRNYWQFRNDENSCCGVCHSGDDVYRTQHINGPFSFVSGIKRLSMTELEIKYYFRRSFKAGDCLTFSQNKNRHTCGIFFSECKNVISENIEINYLAGFGWLSQMCCDLSFENITFKPAKGFHVSSFADLIHICSCKGFVKINNCLFSHPHDDAINIHGSFLRFVKKTSDKSAVFEFVHSQQGGYRAFFPGNKAVFYRRRSLQRIGGEYTVVSANDNINDKTVELIFDKQLFEEINDKYLRQSDIVIENLTYCPDVDISNCKFNAIPTRGILCTTSGIVKIHSNKFSNVGMANIFISNDADEWYESGPVRDVEIYDNDFSVTKYTHIAKADCSAVLIEPITLGKKTEYPIHDNIRIHNNRFDVHRDRAITAYGVDNLVVKDNEFTDISKVFSVKNHTNVK